MDLLSVNDRPGQYPGSYYAAHADIPDPEPAAVGDLRADVCIVGGGFTGLSAALHLSRRGFDVVLLEAQRVGFGASGRNGGQVGTGQRLDQTSLERMLGPDRARVLWQISSDAVELVRSLTAAAGVPFHSGIVHADHQPRFVRESAEYAEKLRTEYGHDAIRFIGRDELRSIVNSDAYFGGTLDTKAGHTDPFKFALGLAAMAKKSGARIFEASRVTDIRHGRECAIRTEKGTIRANHVILACNGYLGMLERSVAAKVMPINNFIIATEPLSEGRKQSLIRQNYAVADSKFVINYFRFSDDNRLLFGGTESYGYRFPKDIVRNVRRPMLKIFPQLRDVRVDHAWGGTLGITMNRMPHFARVAPNVLSLSGYSGHGVAMATIGGQIAADTIAGQAERFDTMESVPSPSFPGGAIMRWPLLVLAMFWYQLRDKI